MHLHVSDDSINFVVFFLLWGLCPPFCKKKYSSNKKEKGLSGAGIEIRNLSPSLIPLSSSSPFFHIPIFKSLSLSEHRTAPHHLLLLESDSTMGSVDKYHVIELVGEGSFGKVYKGRRKYTGQVTLSLSLPKSNHFQFFPFSNFRFSIFSILDCCDEVHHEAR
jgi:hypothetical protein